MTLPDESETFTHDGVRKAVGLARYARELRTWARDVHEQGDATGADDWQPPSWGGGQRGKHERESVSLHISNRYAERFARLSEYLSAEKNALEDETIQQEIELLNTLCEARADTQSKISD